MKELSIIFQNSAYKYLKALQKGDIIQVQGEEVVYTPQWLQSQLLLADVIYQGPIKGRSIKEKKA